MSVKIPPSHSFFRKIPAHASTNAWAQEHSFGFLGTGVRLENQAGTAVEYSFSGQDGNKVDGEIGANGIQHFEMRSEGRIYLRSAAGGEIVHVFAWKKDNE